MIFCTASSCKNCSKKYLIFPAAPNTRLPRTSTTVCTILFSLTKLANLLITFATTTRISRNTSSNVLPAGARPLVIVDTSETKISFTSLITLNTASKIISSFSIRSSVIANACVRPKNTSANELTSFINPFLLNTFDIAVLTALKTLTIEEKIVLMPSAVFLTAPIRDCCSSVGSFNSSTASLT